MKARLLVEVFTSVLIGMLVIVSPILAQDEYDDMYFNKNDRKAVNYKPSNIKASPEADQAMAKNNKPATINATYDADQYGEINENYSSKNINPEYIARYKSNPKENNDEDADSYYVENYERENFEDQSTLSKAADQYTYPSTFNQYYPYMGYNSLARMDPFYGHSAMSSRWTYGMSYGFGYMPGWSMSMSYGYGSPMFYDPWMMSYYNPMYNPYGFYGSAFADPWNSYYYGFPSYRPHYGGYYSYNNYMYMSSGMWSSCGNAYVLDITEKQRNRTRYNNEHSTSLTRGREANVNRNPDAVNLRNTNSNDGTQGISNAKYNNENARTSRDYSRAQNEYYAQSRTSPTTRNVSTASSISRTDGRSYSSSAISSRSSQRSTRTSMDYSRPSYKSSREQSSVGTSSYNRTTSRSSSQSTSGYRSSGSRSSGFSSPSYSSGSSSSGSRSSGSSSSSSGSSGGSRSGRGR